MEDEPDNTKVGKARKNPYQSLQKLARLKDGWQKSREKKARGK